MAFLAQQWYNIVNSYSPFTIEVFGAAMAQLSLTVLFGIYDLNGSDPKRRRAMLKVLPGIGRNIATATVVHSTGLLLMSLWTGNCLWETSLTHVNKNIPSVWRFLIDVLNTALLFEVSFYYFHALFHTKFMYRHVHSVHHHFKEEIAIAAFYSHPLEFLVLNFGLVVIATWLLGSHVLGLLFHGAVAGTIAHFVHTGEDIPGLMSHEGHHVSPNQNLGAIGVLDRLHGTLYRGTQLKRSH
ncbi:hypothetical protein RJZ56_007909 [Blastomyces dermatitidis]|uniref:C-4 methylsterol oxidase n=3 Tax=Blastomyces TaxID=229219 RepID=A0A179UEQ8_BLAGS|nr:C-4 methylsterol oxidase [Blastomyces gilchristii SLH14081]XP_045279560.1 uncharacterized protein BDCG_16345 [Blastomyces dermatitidis ER-3]EGE84343.1 hypothetical protein BDDG_07288 [Blastomyces dermatitidis ATCC 18188]EQL27918.1 hypothetical protein BDFG_09278 [Blastomyces dermatitidis ATCC 26199]EQL27919.1 hypothetical protein, variant [Blastomyces dermatitidis ATCC 26199]OAS99832.1 hypothetical protein BDCG_16345 [Blastomyces dermatitidis ER-3]OAT06454.1 C-4 methylsterol oxidase [Blast